MRARWRNRRPRRAAPPAPSPTPVGERRWREGPESEPAPQPSPARAGRGDGRGVRAGRVMASPASRRRAREAGIDLAQVHGSGPHGRITRAGSRCGADRWGRPGGCRHAHRAAAHGGTGETHRQRRNQGHRRTARDREPHDRREAQHPALRLRRGGRRHRARVAAPAPQREGTHGGASAHLPAVPDRSAGAGARAVPAVQRAVRRRAQRASCGTAPCTSASRRRRRTA